MIVLFDTYKQHFVFHWLKSTVMSNQNAIFVDPASSLGNTLAYRNNQSDSVIELWEVETRPMRKRWRMQRPGRIVYCFVTVLIALLLIATIILWLIPYLTGY